MHKYRIPYCPPCLSSSSFLESCKILSSWKLVPLLKRLTAIGQILGKSNRVRRAISQSLFKGKEGKGITSGVWWIFFYLHGLWGSPFLLWLDGSGKGGDWERFSTRGNLRSALLYSPAYNYPNSSQPHVPELIVFDYRPIELAVQTGPGG